MQKKFQMLFSQTTGRGIFHPLEASFTTYVQIEQSSSKNTRKSLATDDRFVYWPSLVTTNSLACNPNGW